MEGEIFVVTGYGQGHIHPCMQLCNHLSSRNYHTTLIFPSIFASAIPSSFTQHPLTKVAQITFSGRPMPGSDPFLRQSSQDLEAHLVNHSQNPGSPTPLCAVVDFQMGWTKGVFWKFNIPAISLFTFGACAAAMEWGAWKCQAADIKSGEIRTIPGLPEEMALTYSDLKRKSSGPQRGGKGGPPKPGDRPPWVPEIEGSVALMFNTCDDLDGPFIMYMADQTGMPAWGVGPLFPEQYWNSSNTSSLIRDGEISEQKRQSNFTEEEVIQWLDSKQRRSVIYVAFGSEVGPAADEYPELGNALEESTRAFIWVVQPGSEGHVPDGLDNRVGSRAIGRGVPFLAWPIRGDQYFNAKLVVSHLKAGYRVTDDSSQMVNKDDLIKGIEQLMGDHDMKKRAQMLSAKFQQDFPTTSMAALDAFCHFIRQKVN
ncbi:hypothetical protein QYF36_019509 [Acer negundo]|nr:hypothetical protein QYF36_019509 [Acer negundo]